MKTSFDDTDYFLGKLDMVIGIQLLYNRTCCGRVLNDKGYVRNHNNCYSPIASMGLVDR